MRITLLYFFFLLLAASAHAQLVNPSFEDGGVFSLTGWEWTCDTPTAVNDTPPGGGDWSARKDMGDPDCSPSYLFQRIPFVNSGDQWAVGGWVCADTIGWDALPRFGFSSVSNGVFAFQSQIGSPAQYWNYVWITDTVHASATDTAVVLLTSGTGFLGSGWFDEFELWPMGTTGLTELASQLHTFLDADQVLHLATGGAAIRSVRLFDAAGRVLPAQVRLNTVGASIDTAEMRPGVYIIQVSTDAGPVASRFVKPG